MKSFPPSTPRQAIFVEALEPRIAPAGLLNETKFATITLGTPQLLDASGGPGSYQGLSTGPGGSGQYLLYITSGKALVFTSDIAGNGRYEPGDITGIAAGVDGQGHPLNLILFTDVHGDIVTDLLPGAGVSQLTDSDNNPANGRDGRVLLGDSIASITLRTVTAGDLDATIPGDTVANRLALTHFSIYGNIYTGGSFGGLTIDTSGAGALAAKFSGATGDELFTTADPTIGDIYTGTAASFQPFHFTQLAGTAAIQGTLLPFSQPAGLHGGDISNIAAADSATIFNIGTLETGNGGFGARGGDLSDITLHTNGGAYQLIAGDGGDGTVGAPGGSIDAFSDLGSLTGEILLHTGAGGSGLLGTGGDGGTATFGTINAAAGVDVLLGHGGNGFTNGGTGAGLPAATFSVPEAGIPIGGQFEGTYHVIGDVGNTFQLPDHSYSPHVIDFNGDGFGDAVYSTTNPDQLVVVFGDGARGLVDSAGNANSAAASETIRLNAPGPITSFVVGDFNGDGKPDIAVASADPGNAGGIYVFLNQIGNPVLDPVGAHNFTHNPLGAHPFSTPLQSALPTLTDQGFYAGTGGILALAAGDFGGNANHTPDGIMDIAYAEQVTVINGAGDTLETAVGILFGSAVRDPKTGAVLTNPVTGRPEGSGYFFANDNTQASSGPVVPLYLTTMLNTPILKVSSLTSTNVPSGGVIPTSPETIFFGLIGVDGTTSTALTTLQFNTAAPGNFIIGDVNLGKVDTNRAPGPTNVALADVTLQDFTLQDIDGDGNVDIVTLSKAPVEFLVTLQGNGAGGFNIVSGDAADQAGLYLSTDVATKLAPIDGRSAGMFEDVAALTFEAPGSGIVEYSLVTAGGGFATSASAPGVRGAGSPIVDDVAGNQAITAFDAFYEHVESSVNPHPTTGFGVLTPDSALNEDSFVQIYATSHSFINQIYFETDNGFRIYSGDGGNATVGSGGNAGAIGNGTLTVATSGIAQGAINFTLPAYPDYNGDSLLLGGRGGNGFTAGGNGGDITGISSIYTLMATSLSSGFQLRAGNGGSAIAGNGGRGGMLGEFSLTSGTFFSAGNGGTGLAGGAGGSVTGNNQGVYDAYTDNVTVLTGSGGTGTATGGFGGNISSFDTVFPPFLGGTGGSLDYITGKGGNAAGGVGGNGGNIVDSSPDASVNNLAGEITLVTGVGGSGLTGGSGGGISSFVNSPTSSSLPTTVDVATGAGGIGISGTGGDGGTITNLQVSATGLDAAFFPLNPVTILSGNGGNSYATTGGAGGDIVNSTVEVTSAPLAVAAGAGGNAPVAGGSGGSVTNSVLASAAQNFGKMLVIAGDGGNATAVTKASVSIPGDNHINDLKHQFLAFGGANGIGGNGGDITGITQPTGADTAVDLIAGNGGSTINSGGPLQAITGVGMGGSVSNITLAGTVGSIERFPVPVTYPPIKSYTDLNGNGTDAESTATFIADDLGGAPASLTQTSDFSHAFVSTYFLNNPGVEFALTDAVGNVGIVAGRAGFIKGGQAASDGVNGSVQDVAASSIMSIVAGSVNRVAPVQLISGITITNSDGVLGADKSLPLSATAGGPNGQLDYYNPAGQDVQNLAAGDRLIDGALYAITVDLPAGPRIFAITNNG
jgi:hypothetical protein